MNQFLLVSGLIITETLILIIFWDYVIIFECIHWDFKRLFPEIIRMCIDNITKWYLSLNWKILLCNSEKKHYCFGEEYQWSRIERIPFKFMKWNLLLFIRTTTLVSLLPLMSDRKLIIWLDPPSNKISYSSLILKKWNFEQTILLGS